MLDYLLKKFGLRLVVQDKDKIHMYNSEAANSIERLHPIKALSIRHNNWIIKIQFCTIREVNKSNAISRYR